jgi:hypothetical protein
MSTKNFPPFLKWGDYKSTSKEKPDVITIEIVDPEPFQTQYDWNVLGKIDGIETNIPLRAKTANKKLYRQYMSLLQNDKIKSKTTLVIKTYLSKSTKNPDYDLREFEVKLL